MCLEAYAAGVMDGDGSIQIQRVTRNGAYRLTIYLSGCNDKPLYSLQRRWGGGITHSRTLTGRPYHRWHLTSYKAAEFLEDILEFLIGKEDQAELALRFQFSKRNRSADQDMMNLMRSYSVRGKVIKES